MLPSRDVHVARDSDRFYLVATELDTPPANDQFYDVARKLITRINGLARSQNPSFAPMNRADSYDQGDGVTVVGTTAHLVVRATVTATAEVIGPDSLPMPQAPPPGHWEAQPVVMRGRPVAATRPLLLVPRQATFARVTTWRSRSS